MGSVLPQHPGFGTPSAGDGACIRILYLDQFGTPQASVTYTTQSSAELLEQSAAVRQAFDLMHAALGLELLSITVGTLAGAAPGVRSVQARLARRPKSTPVRLGEAGPPPQAQPGQAAAHGSKRVS